MQQINVLAELERISWAFEPSSSDEVRLRCPFHEDRHASCSMNVKKGLFKCQAEGACGASGDIVTFIARALKTERAVVWADLSTRYDLDNAKTVDADYVERAHSKIGSAGPLLEELRARGVTDAMIRKHRLGYDQQRITIPIKNAAGVYVNVRKYLPGAPGEQKMRNVKGRSKLRLFPIEQLKYQTLLLAGGEIKAIVAAEQLNPHDVGAVCVTGAEGTWTDDLGFALAGKDIVVCMDIDKHGQGAALKLAKRVYAHAASVCILTLPLDPEQYPHGDVNDYIARENGDVYALLNTAEPYTANEAARAEFRTARAQDVLRVGFTETSEAANVGRRVEFEAVVTASLDTPFNVPESIRIHCERDQPCCERCPINDEGSDEVLEIPSEAPGVLKMIGVSDAALELSAREFAGVPRQCGACSVEIVSYRNVEDVRLSPVLDIENRSTERAMQPAACVACDAELNNTYRFVGTLWPSPRNQQATLLMSEATPTLDALSRYEPENLDALSTFRPREYSLEGVREKFDEIYSDLEANVTHIYLRRDLHLFVDLAYHSPLLLRLDKKRIKGWAEILIVGDSSQGKSEVSRSLHEFYGLGERVDCKNATLAGLIGGLQQLGTEWYVTWGSIPSQDKRLVILEELKGLHLETISRMTDMRSSGVAELTKIRKRRAHARTRLIGISNVRPEGRTVSSYSYGVESVLDLIGAPEDVRRFDAALIVSAKDVDPAELNRLINDPPQVEQRFTRDACRELILWAWTRSQEQIAFDKDARDFLSRSAAEMASSYSAAIPLVDSGSMREKLARLSASVAARTFSTGPDQLTLRVRLCHVQFVVELLTRVYSSPTFGYDVFSEMSRVSTQLKDAKQLQSCIEALPFPEELRSQMMLASNIELIDLCDWTGYDRQAAQELLSLFVRKRALRRVGRSYVKNDEFTSWLKRVVLTPKRPQHIPVEDF